MVLSDRMNSECSEDGDIDIRPLEFGDLRRGVEDDSSSDDDSAVDLSCGGDRFFSAVFSARLKRCRERKQEKGLDKKTICRMKWKNAILKARTVEDPWEKFHLESFESEKAIRHRYNPLTEKWKQDEVIVKMEDEPFGNGAMRECYRMKKLSNFSMKDDWKKAHNYVAKLYMDEDTKRETYFEDVKLQMDAKLWGEEYNRHNPPKKIDIFQMCILEMVDRPGTPFFHLEHFIEGKYVKYNSNSGFVLSKALRMTPQAFSHFTFERSGHELIVVDIQGVGDLYTDPQIHTAYGLDYGDGNLGAKGMALFFNTHKCNSICKSLALEPFDIAPSEITTIEKAIQNNKNLAKSFETKVRGTEEQVMTPDDESFDNIQEFIRHRSLSSGFHDDLAASPRIRFESCSSFDSVEDELPKSESEDSAIASEKLRNFFPPTRPARLHLFSESESDSTTFKNNEKFEKRMLKKSRPSHILGEVQHREMLKALEEEREKENQQSNIKKNVTGGSILGRIHLELAKYHELNRFVEENQEYDREAALFHVEMAARCGDLQAMLTLARLHLSMPHDILPDIELPGSECNPGLAFDFVLTASEAGDRWAMIYAARAFDTGNGLPDDRSCEWSKAVKWYESVVNHNDVDEDGDYDSTMDDPAYLLLARQAAMYLEGGHGLQKDPTTAAEKFEYAAELATEAMKGKLASKYFMLAEEAWGQVED